MASELDKCVYHNFPWGGGGGGRGRARGEVLLAFQTRTTEKSCHITLGGDTAYVRKYILCPWHSIFCF